MKLQIFQQIFDKLADSEQLATITLKSGATVAFTPATTNMYAIEEKYSKELECIPTPSVIVLEGADNRMAYIEVEEIAMVTI